MNNTLKHWREAATLILAAGAQDGNEISKIQNSSQQALPHAPKGISFDYDVLLLKRSQKSGFVPNAFVFPGGLVDASDFSNDWLKIFDKYNQKPNFGLGLVKQNPSGRSPMFVTDRTKFGSLLPSEVAFRICAIRETFEECGILLVVPENSDVEDNQNITSISDHDPQVLGKWRREVQSNPFQFIQLCKEMHCVPNIWALHEWSNWLTPVLPNTSSIRRYDTAFYICCLQKKPLAIEDDKEVTSFKWWSPWEVLEEFKSQNIWLPPPQFYELSRLCVVPDIHELHRFTHRRALEGCEQWMPILVRAEDGMLHVLPGDELYPDEPDYTGEKKMLYSTDKTIEDLMKNSVRCHRYLQHNGIAHLCVNMEQKYKHLTPLSTDQTQSAKPKSRM
ncbi:acyl-coenzyme A diphosphatase NUDT19 [Spea bombifrons]|uniref:acyl-coenzyme A diphosphatase NUDT19 n=1 Tax=Spea bombifrons TaxID=233779 RepID=UPI00234B70A2|nr:acyl-coenzyme A diphosphatase NUDT19 [Spea bombifrons]